jgi:hypothetical protein
MNATRNAGVIRLMGFGSVAALALFAHGARAQGGGAAAGPLPTRYIIVKDSIGGDRTLVLQVSRIDSLMKRRNALPMGTPEFVAVDSALQVALQSLPRSTGVATAGGKFQIEFTAPRVALRGSLLDVIPQGWLGFTAALAVNRDWYGPQGQYVEYFEYPTIVDVEGNSPASRAGVRVGDLVLAYDGRDVRSQPINLTRMLEPGREITVRVRRDGESKEFDVKVEKAPASLAVERRAAATEFMASLPPMGMDERRIVELNAATAVRRTMPGTPVAVGPQGAPTAMAGTLRAVPAMAPSSAMLGAAMTEVTEDHAGALVGMKGKRGVLVTIVPEGSPAYRTGLRSLDVILRVGSFDVTNPAMLRARLREAEQDGSDKVKLTVLRAGKTREITYAPPR